MLKRLLRSIINTVSFFLVIWISIICITTDVPVRVKNYVEMQVEIHKNNYEDYSADFHINELEINLNTYYYDRLTDEQKKVYSSIANAVRSFRTEFVVKDYLTADKDKFSKDVTAAMEAFTNDHPEVFYLQTRYSSYIVPAFLEQNYGYIKISYTEETIEAVNEKLEKLIESVDEYVAMANNGYNDFEKELIVHDEFAYRVLYSDAEEYPRKCHTIEGPMLENVGVCDGFAKSLQVIYNRVGIDSIIVIGTLEGNPHAWNEIKLDDEWYHTDVTSAQSVMKYVFLVHHGYFNMTEERLKKVCTIDNPELIPTATGEKYSYYNYYGYKIDGDLTQKIQEIYDSSKHKNFIEFHLNGHSSDIIADILVILEKIDKRFVKESKMYYYNIENAIIIPKN